MSESSLLQDATRALRALEAEHDEAGSTEQRVLETMRVRRERARWTRRIATGLVLSLFVAGTGHAAFLGAGPAWNAVLNLFGPPPSARPPPAARPRAEGATLGQAARAKAPPGGAGIDATAPARADTPAVAVAPRARPRVRPPSAATAEAREAPAGAAELPSSEALYAEAHRLHFVLRDRYSALDAWNRYLAARPRGGLSPEARYNRALCLVALDRKQQALDALAPIAAGVDGEYRRREAQKLLRALRAAIDGRQP